MGVTWVLFPCGLLFLLLLPLFCSLGAEVVTVDVHAAKDLIHSGHRYLDVRTVEEFKKGHVDAENALNIPYMFNTPEGRVKNPQFLEQVLSACSKDDRLVVGCQSGVRSLYATADLLNADFKHACNMGGGYLAWVENRFAVRKPELVENGFVEKKSELMENGFAVKKPEAEL